MSQDTLVLAAAGALAIWLWYRWSSRGGCCSGHRRQQRDGNRAAEEAERQTD